MNNLINFNYKGSFNYWCLCTGAVGELIKMQLKEPVSIHFLIKTKDLFYGIKDVRDSNYLNKSSVFNLGEIFFLSKLYSDFEENKNTISLEKAVSLIDKAVGNHLNFSEENSKLLIKHLSDFGEFSANKFSRLCKKSSSKILS